MRNSTPIRTVVDPSCNGERGADIRSTLKRSMSSVTVEAEIKANSRASAGAPMDETTPEGGTVPAIETPEALLDALRGHPEWPEERRADVLDRLVAGFPRERWAEAILVRLGDLGGGDGEAVLQLVEALDRPEMFEALAEALVGQPDLPPERAWIALGMLEGTGLIEAYPELAERRDELAEASEEEESSLDQLA